MLLQSAADAMPKATKWAGPPNAGWGGGNGPLNLARLAKVVDTLEDAGRIPAMAAPSVPMKVRHQTPGNLDLRARKDNHAHAHAPAIDRCRGGRCHERRP